MVEAGGADLKYCSSFKAFHRLINTALSHQCICSGGVLTAMRSNQICFWITFTDLLWLNGMGFWLFQLFFCFSILSHFLCSFSGFISFCQIINGLPNTINDWAQYGF